MCGQTFSQSMMRWLSLRPAASLIQSPGSRAEHKYNLTAGDSLSWWDEDRWGDWESEEQPLELLWELAWSVETLSLTRLCLWSAVMLTPVWETISSSETELTLATICSSSRVKDAGWSLSKQFLKSFDLMSAFTGLTNHPWDNKIHRMQNIKWDVSKDHS